MSFSLYGLLSKNSPQLSNELLAKKLKTYFRNEKDFSLEFEEIPFTGDTVLNLRFGDWHANVSYEDDEVVKEDSIEIQKRTAALKSHDVSGVTRRIRILFGDDSDKKYTNEIVYLMDFLGEIDGIIIYDPQQNDFL